MNAFNKKVIIFCLVISLRPLTQKDLWILELYPVPLTLEVARVGGMEGSQDSVCTPASSISSGNQPKRLNLLHNSHFLPYASDTCVFQKHKVRCMLRIPTLPLVLSMFFLKICKLDLTAIRKRHIGIRSLVACLHMST